VESSVGGLQKWSVSRCGSSVGGSRGEAPLLGIWKDMGRRAQGTGTSLRGGPVGELSRSITERNGYNSFAQLNNAFINKCLG
jgi:hypothetical protein